MGGRLIQSDVTAFLQFDDPQVTFKHTPRTTEDEIVG